MSYAKQIFTKTLNVDQFNKGPTVASGNPGGSGLMLYFNKAQELVSKLPQPFISSFDTIDSSNSITYNYTFSDPLTLFEGLFEVHLHCYSQQGTIIKLSNLSLNNQDLLVSSSNITVPSTNLPSRTLLYGSILGPNKINTGDILSLTFTNTGSNPITIYYQNTDTLSLIVFLSSVAIVGPAGKDGKDGKDGLLGPIGPAGKDGLLGPIGPAGKDGLIGPAGKDGLLGPAGKDGLDGLGG